MRLPLLLWLPLGLSSTACQLQRPLDRPAWSHAERGTFGWIGRAGVWADYSAASEITFDSNFGAQRIELDTELDGRLGLVLGGEYFVADDWSVLAGYDHRRFEPGATPGFLFQTVTSEELFVALRWLTPWCFGDEDRWRPYVQLKFGYLPRTRFDSEIDLTSIGQPNPQYRFDGSAYWNLGLSAGLQHQLRDDLVFQVSALYETPLDPSRDAVDLEFLPGFPITLDTSIEPEGVLVLIGLTWYP